MAINKNFVVKNGLEVNTNLLVADGTRDKVGIGSTFPRTELDVRGGIAATDIYISGVGTIVNLQAINATVTSLSLIGPGFTAGVGTLTALKATHITASGVTTTATLEVTGTGRIVNGIVTSLLGNNLNILGFSTFNAIGAERLNVSGISTLAIIQSTNLNVSGLTTLGGYVDINNSVDISNNLKVSGITTLGITTATSINAQNLNVSGITTIQNIDVLGEFNVYDSTATFHNNLYIAGNLSIGGTTSAVAVADLKVLDKEITLGITTNAINNDVSNDTTANHGGIAIASTEGFPLVNLSLAGFSTTPSTYKQLMWVAANSYGIGTTDAWLFNYGVGIGSTNVPNGVRLAVKEIQFTDNTIRTPNLNVAGISTLGTVKVSSGIITAASGIVTYYGDGSYLNGVKPSIYKLGTFVGAGTTLLDFRGSGIATVTVNSGIATIFVEGGGGGATLQTQIYKEVFSPTSSGITTFTLSNGYDTGYIDVFVNGAKLSSNDFTETASNIITLSSAAAIGDNVEFVNYQTVATGFTTSSFATQAYGLINSPTITVTDITARNINASGILTAANIITSGIVTALDFNATSDRNLKTNIEVISNPLDKIVQINGVSFNWKETNQTSAGVIAQEVEQIMPQIIHDNEKGYKTLNYNGLIGLLIESVKELKCEIEDLKSKLNLNS